MNQDDIESMAREMRESVSGPLSTPSYANRTGVYMSDMEDALQLKQKLRGESFNVKITLDEDKEGKPRAYVEVRYVFIK